MTAEHDEESADASAPGGPPRTDGDRPPPVDADADAPVTVRPARGGELAAVMNVLDGAMLAVDAATVAERIEADAVLVADDGGRIVGALVVDAPERGGLAPRPEEIRPETRHVEAVAVRRRRRGQGIGRRLVEAAAGRCDYLTADYRAEVRPFYEALGFSVTDDDGERLRGMR